jgi:hypothetical protein
VGGEGRREGGSRTFFILAFSAVSSLPALAACRFSDFAVNCGGKRVLADGGGGARCARAHARANRRTETYFELEEGLLEAGHGCRSVGVGLGWRLMLCMESDLQSRQGQVGAVEEDRLDGKETGSCVRW